MTVGPNPVLDLGVGSLSKNRKHLGEWSVTLLHLIPGEDQATADHRLERDNVALALKGKGKWVAVTVSTFPTRAVIPRGRGLDETAS